MEYDPLMSQCQRYTAAPANAAQPLATSRMDRLMVNGTPLATPDAEPKLDRMSLRTMPLWVRTSGPLDPSPGYGPAVSCGISVLQLAAPVAATAEAAPVAAFVAPAVALDVAEVGLSPADAQPASAARPAPASRPSIRRRCNTVETSNCSPRSWS